MPFSVLLGCWNMYDNMYEIYKDDSLVGQLTSHTSESPQGGWGRADCDSVVDDLLGL